MSYRAMLKMRCNVRRSRTGQEDGLTSVGYETIAGAGTELYPAGVPCLLDLNFIRKGKDPMWTPEAGRPSTRTGVWFGPADGRLTVMSGDWIEMTRGPSGVYQIEGAVDEAWTPDRYHHPEIGVKEVARTLATPQLQIPDEQDPVYPEVGDLIL